MADLKSTLRDFGLTDNEATTYLVLLGLGSATASEITKKTQIHRINIYDILERLQEKGLVSFIMIGKRKSYEACNPEKILEIEERRRKSIKKIIPELTAARALSKGPSEATIYKEKAGIKTVLDEITKTKENIYLFASGGGFKEHFGEYYEIWHERVRRSKAKMKVLISRKFKTPVKNLKLSDYRYLPSEFVFPSTTVVYGNKLVIGMWSAHSIAILIRSKEIADSYKNFFKILWRYSKP